MRAWCSALQGGSSTEASCWLPVWHLLMLVNPPALVIGAQNQGKCLIAFSEQN